MDLICYIVDDEFHACDVLKTYIEKTPGLKLLGCATEPQAALKDVIVSNPPDITFLDIDMPVMSGIELAGLISLYTSVVFTTSHPEFAIEAFEKEAFDYLLKPFGYERFLRTIAKFKKRPKRTEGLPASLPGYFFIKTDVKGKMLRIVINDIRYVEAALNYVTIHSVTGKHMAYLTMEEVASRLPPDQFMRVHRSFIINKERISTLEQGRLTLDDGSVISLGRLYKEPLLTSMKELLLQSKRTNG